MRPPQAPRAALTTSGNAPAADLRYALLGPLAVHTADGAPLDVRAPKTRALLAMLLLEAGRPVSRDRLTAALWGEDPPATASTALNNHVVQLRRRLGPDGPARLRTAAPGYRLDVRPGELDTEQFTARLHTARAARHREDWLTVSLQTTAALALWRGTPLSDLPEPASCAAQPYVQQLEESRLEALEWRFEAELHLGRHHGLIPELGRATAEHPLREAFHRQLMLALHRADQRAEALAVYRRLRATLVEELGIEPGGPAQAVHQRILDDEPAAGASDEPAGPVDPAGSAGATGPESAATAGAGLPRDIAGFTGRDGELRRLLAACRATGTGAAAAGVVGIHAVDGMPGVGKTALAVHAAHLLAADFPDGQIFLPLHAHTSGTPAVDPADALAALLLAIGVGPQLIPPGLHARAGLWRSRLAGRRMLLLLDDARCSDQIAPLLPGTPGTLVLVTSRRRLPALEDAVPITLDVLPPGEAAELFCAKAGRPDLSPRDPAVVEAARLCGHLPLALHLTAARLRHHRSWSVADLLPELDANSGRLTALQAEDVSVAAAFDLSYRELAPDQRRLFRRLGLHPGDDWDARAAAALDGTDRAAAQRLLEELENHHLIEEPVRGRYRMHDLIREHARALAGADDRADREAAVDRLLDHYLATATAADRHLARYTPEPYEPSAARESGGAGAGWAGAGSAGSERAECARAEFETLEAATAWFAAERANLRAAVEYAAGHGRPLHAVRLPAAMHEFLRAQGHWQQAEALHRLALDTARAAGDLRGEAGALTGLGVVGQLSGRLEPSAEHLRRALELYRSLGDRRGEATAGTNLGHSVHLSGRFAEAAELHREALELYRSLGDRLGEATVLTSLGHVQQLGGQRAQAAENLETALPLFRALGNRLGQANTLFALGLVRELTGPFPTAAACHREALELFRGLGNRFGQGNALFALGIAERLLGEYESAVARFTEALDLYRELGYRLGQANALVNHALTDRLTGRYEAAETGFQTALELYREAGDGRGVGNATAYLGYLRHDTGRHEEARAQLAEALEAFRDSGFTLGEARALACLGSVQRALGERREAERSLRRAVDLCREITDRGTEADALTALGGLLAENGSRPEAREAYEAALDVAKAAAAPVHLARAQAGLADTAST